MTNKTEGAKRLEGIGLRPSVQRTAIMDYLLTHPTHPTVDDVYQALCPQIPTLSRATVYNTLRLFAEKKIAQMITIDDHRVCYDGNTNPHVHFFCKECGRVYDLMDEKAPVLKHPILIDGNEVDEEQLYYKGICKACREKHQKSTS